MKTNFSFYSVLEHVLCLPVLVCMQLLIILIAWCKNQRRISWFIAFHNYVKQNTFDIYISVTDWFATSRVFYKCPDRFRAVQTILRPSRPYAGNFPYSIVFIYFATMNKNAIEQQPASIPQMYTQSMSGTGFKSVHSIYFQIPLRAMLSKDPLLYGNHALTARPNTSWLVYINTCYIFANTLHKYVHTKSRVFHTLTDWVPVQSDQHQCPWFDTHLWTQNKQSRGCAV